ncbi:MAG: tyrosine-type recombinase/integrase [Kiritimatiellia bacterium]|jgi:site-specific recombinase XerD
MKNQLVITSSSLPEKDQVFEMILRLDQPFQSLAWLMLETGAKLSELQDLRVRDLQLDRGQLQRNGRAWPLSDGLQEALADYLRLILRPAFEQLKRKSGQQMFSATRLFPAWLLDGQESAPLDAFVSTADFVSALQSAASASGYSGRVHSNTLRLVTARSWLEQGMAIPALHETLGHRDLMTTLLLVQTLQQGGLSFLAAGR